MREETPVKEESFIAEWSDEDAEVYSRELKYSVCVCVWLCERAEEWWDVRKKPGSVNVLIKVLLCRCLRLHQNQL